MHQLITLKYIILFLSLLFAESSLAQQIAIPKKEALANDRDFRIVNVIDGRRDTSNNGYLKNDKNDKEPIVFTNGLASALMAAMGTDRRNDTGVTEVELVILKFEIRERRKRGSSIADVDISYGFKIHGQQHFVLSSEIQTAAKPDAIARVISSQNEKMLTKFDKWFTNNKDNVAILPTVTVNISVSTRSSNPRYIMYNGKRKLNYGDFQRRPQRASKFGAATASGIYMESRGLSIYNRTLLNVTVGASFNKKHSWFKKNAKTRYVLDHEQLHYDITAYVTCEFIKKLKETTFSTDKYMEELKQMLKLYNERLDKMQNEYDGESNHGLIKEQQAAWQQKMDTLTAGQDCYDVNPTNK